MPEKGEWWVMKVIERKCPLAKRGCPVASDKCTEIRFCVCEDREWIQFGWKKDYALLEVFIRYDILLFVTIRRWFRELSKRYLRKFAA